MKQEKQQMATDYSVYEKQKETHGEEVFPILFIYLLSRFQWNWHLMFENHDFQRDMRVEEDITCL